MDGWTDRIWRIEVSFVDIPALDMLFSMLQREREGESADVEQKNTGMR